VSDEGRRRKELAIADWRVQEVFVDWWKSEGGMEGGKER
jgi:hypothetical protein